MDDQNKNLLLATLLSFVVIVIWFVLFPPPEKPVDPNAPVETSTTETGGTENSGLVPSTGEGQAATATAEGAEAAETQAPRVQIDTPRVTGSISLRGGRFDDLKLKDYLTTLDPDAEMVTVLRP